MKHIYHTYGVRILITNLLLILVTSISILLSAGLQTQQVPGRASGAPRAFTPVPPDPNYRPQACTAPVTNLSQRAGNEGEGFVAINPTNPNNIVAFSNIDDASVSSIFRAYSIDGGSTWTTGTIAQGVACCDGQAAFDEFGNLFLVYINAIPPTEVKMILSTDGGVTFSMTQTVGIGPPDQIDQPSIAVGNGSVWVAWTVQETIKARGAPVTGLGAWGPFDDEQSLPEAIGGFSGIAVGPGPNGGKVMVTYMRPIIPKNREGPSRIYVDVDADGLGPDDFAPRIIATTSNVGTFDRIPAQYSRSTDAEPGLVWDTTGGPFNNRVYLVYAEEIGDESDDTDIYVRTSTNSGSTWSAPVRVNDDPEGPIRSQFLPYITLDPTSGTVAVGWHDSRNDNGAQGSGGTNSIPNDDAEYYASYSTDGGATWAANTRLSGGFSNASNAGSGVDYGDYVGTNAYGGKFVAAWADNSNCDGTNANGTLGAFDLYLGVMNITGVPPPGCEIRTYTYDVSTGTIAPPKGKGDIGNHCDNCVTYISFGNGFYFRLYNQTFSGANISSNGNIQFVGAVTDPHYPSQDCLPATDFTHTIFAQWGELSTEGTYQQEPLGVYTSMTGTAPNRVYNIEWRACKFEKGKDGSLVCTSYLNFEVQLHESESGGNDNPTGIQSESDFDVVYGLGPGGFDVLVGVQKDLENYTQYECHVSNSLPQGRKLMFSLSPPCPPTPTPVPPPTNTYTPTHTPTPTPTACPTGCGRYADVLPNNTFFTPIMCLTCRGIVSGYPCGGPDEPCVCGTPPNGLPYFRPGNNVTRGQLAKMISNAAGYTDVPTNQTYEDVPLVHPFYLWIMRLSTRGIMGGYPCGGANEPCTPGPPSNRPYFRPYQDSTRSQLAKTIALAKVYNVDPGSQVYQDVPTFNEFYVHINRLYQVGVMTGYPCGGANEPCIPGSPPNGLPYFRPYYNATRGQVAKTVYSAYPGCPSGELPGPGGYPVEALVTVSPTALTPLPLPSPSQPQLSPTVVVSPPPLPSAVPSVPVPVPSVPVPPPVPSVAPTMLPSPSVPASPASTVMPAP